jgi:hypothetical protein
VEVKNREPDRLFHPLRGASPAVARHFVRVRASSSILFPRDELKVLQEPDRRMQASAAFLDSIHHFPANASQTVMNLVMDRN